MPRKVVSASGMPVTVATMEDISGGGSVTVENITDATELGKSILLAVDVPTLLTIISALGSSGDQNLDGELTVTDGLTIRSPQQTSANVISFFFGPNDGVLDASIKATATADNKGQLALGVNDDSGGVANAFTIDGSSKQMMVLAGYKLLVGASGTDISGITSFGKQLIECQDAAAVKTLLGL